MIENEYLLRCTTESDINEHLPLLRSLAESCETIVELGTRSGNSTVAFLASAPASLTCIDLSFSSLDETRLRGYIDEAQTQWTLLKRNSLDLSPRDIPECDMLFIDTLHTYTQIAHELTFASRVKRIIAIHDTVLFWDNGQKGQRGIGPAISEFLDSEYGSMWEVSYESSVNNGMMVLTKKRSTDYGTDSHRRRSGHVF